MTASIPRRPAPRWTPAQLYLWIWGPLLLVLGVGSLIVHPDFSLGSDVTARHLFGVFHANGWHGLLGLLTGAAALVFVQSERYSTSVAALIGVGAGVVPAGIFFVVGSGSVALGLIPVDLADGIWLHLVPGVIGVGDGERRPARSRPNCSVAGEPSSWLGAALDRTVRHLESVRSSSDPPGLQIAAPCSRDAEQCVYA